MNALPFAKPGSKDRRVREDYHRRHPLCEVGCGRRDAEPVPLIPYTLGGGDSESNLVSLCWFHHQGPAGLLTLGPREWLARCGASLEPETLTRVARVLGSVEE